MFSRYRYFYNRLPSSGEVEKLIYFSRCETSFTRVEKRVVDKRTDIMNRSCPRYTYKLYPLSFVFYVTPFCHFIPAINLYNRCLLCINYYRNEAVYTEYEPSRIACTYIIAKNSASNDARLY